LEVEISRESLLLTRACCTVQAGRHGASFLIQGEHLSQDLFIGKLHIQAQDENGMIRVFVDKAISSFARGYIWNSEPKYVPL
jgi:hypothetical protein